MSSNEPSSKSDKKRKTFQPEFEDKVRTYGSSAKKPAKTTSVVEAPLSPKRSRRSLDTSKEASGSKGLTLSSSSEPDSKQRKSDSMTESESESGYSDSDSDSKAKGEGKKSKKHKSKRKKRKSKSREDDRPLDESSEDEVVAMNELSAETQAAIVKLIESDKKKKKKKKQKPKAKSEVEDSKAGVKSIVKREEDVGGRAPTDGEINSIIVNYLRTTLTHLTGWSTFYDIQPALEGTDGNGNPQCWETTPTGDSKLRPLPDDSFETNWKLWGPDYIAQWRDKSVMGLNVDILSPISEDIIKNKLRTITWKSVMEAWKRNKGGNGDQARNERNIKSAERNRTTAKLTSLTVARKGTPFEGPEYNFLFAAAYISRETSDAENDKRAVVDDPSHRSDLVRHIYGALQQKSKSERKRTSAARKETRVYIKVDAPIPELINSVRISRWAIDNVYFETHQAEIQKKIAYIDMDATNPPDLTEFFKRYGKGEREYLQSRPRPKKPRTETVLVISSASNQALNPGPTPEVSVPQSGLEIELDPALQNDNPPSKEPEAQNGPLTPKSTPNRPQQAPKLLPYKSSKTANELAAQYAADSARRQSEGLHLPDTSSIANNPLQTFAGTRPDSAPSELATLPSESTPAPNPNSRGRKSAAQKVGAVQEKRTTRSQAKQIEQDNGERAGETSEPPSGPDTQKKYPTRLRR